MTIINRDQGFIFLKSRKTAGSSLELHLIKNTELGGDIYYTVPEAACYGLLRRKRDTLLRLFGSYIYTSAPVSMRKYMLALSEHASAKCVRRFVKPVFWEKAVKVCGVRNPWDLLVSYWRWRSGGAGGRRDAVNAPFEPWARASMSGDVREIKKHHSIDARRLLHNFLFIDGSVAVQHIIRFESLDKGIQELSEILGVNIPPLEIYEKASCPVNYQSYYCPSLANEVGDYFSDVIDSTGYSF